MLINCHHRLTRLVIEADEWHTKKDMKIKMERENENRQAVEKVSKIVEELRTVKNIKKNQVQGPPAKSMKSGAQNKRNLVTSASTKRRTDPIIEVGNSLKK